MGQSTKSSLRKAADIGIRRLRYDDSYSCPICAQGQLSTLVLTDAFACSFCRHIFTANLNEQSIQALDSVRPMVWRWTGNRWRSAHQQDSQLAFVVWGVSLVLAALPVGLILLSAYLFPPLESSDAIHFPILWAFLTFCLHGLMVGWLISEHYQWPWYVAMKVSLQQRP